MLTSTAHAKLGEGIVLANGESGVFAGVPVEAVPAYDMTPGQPWHPKGEANGYVITLGGRRIFFSGVGECVPEIQALQRIDVAFMPMNLPLDRMRPVPVAECVKTFRPEILYTIHYDNATARWFENPEQPRPENAVEIAATIQTLRDALADEPVEVRDGDWYPQTVGTSTSTPEPSERPGRAVLRQDLLDNPPADIREAEVAALMPVGQFLVVKP